MSSTPNDKRDPLAGWSHPEPPFHEGERALQARHGLAQRMEQVGRRVMREGMPDQHRAFFEELPFVLVGSVDHTQRPWASILTGEPGFLRSPDATSLVVHARPSSDDPLAEQLVPGAKLGLLGIQFDTRRRNRMNGRVQTVDDDGFSLTVEQSFGNCPKYIHQRPSQLRGSPAMQRGPVTKEGAWLSARAQEITAEADTFFIASASPELPGSEDHARGSDVSHRGGPRGFVRLERGIDGHVLVIPDYSGNYFFNTLGNLLLHPHAGVLFIDFDDGTLLQLTGSTELVLEGPDVEREPGAERLLRFRVEDGQLLQSFVRMRAD